MSKKSVNKITKVASSPSVAELNSNYKETKFVQRLKCAFKEQTHFEEGNKLILHNEPFTCCSIADFLENESFLNELKDELLNLEYFEKNNDLYKFHQSDDLKKAKSPYIVALRKFLYGDFRDWVQNVTGLTLATTVDMSCARYDHTDILLCHDDMLEGRRIAYILYLVPAWKASDGGELNLFSIDENGDPAQVAKSITPQWNSFVFFEVDHRSFHQVAEVLTEDKTRLSISGWFYGQPLDYPSKRSEPLPIMLSPTWLEQEEVLEWINPLYLKVETQMEIQQTFQADSEMELADFLSEEKYKEVAEALREAGVTWKMLGPPNKKMYEVGESSSLPPILLKCLQLMRSEAMFLILSNLTGLTLHELAMESNDSEDDDNDEEESVDESVESR